MHSDRYASHEFLQVLHAKEYLSESLCLRYSLGRILNYNLLVQCVRASVLLHLHALQQLVAGFSPAGGVSVCVSFSFLMPCWSLGLGISVKGLTNILINRK